MNALVHRAGGEGGLGPTPSDRRRRRDHKIFKRAPRPPRPANASWARRPPAFASMYARALRGNTKVNHRNTTTARRIGLL